MDWYGLFTVRASVQKNLKQIPALSENDCRRFLSFFAADAGLDCWPWVGYQFKRRGGYGRFFIKERPFYAHRVSYFYHFGVDPLGLCVCHHCDNPVCVNPGHLYLGTDKENTMDKMARGRHRFGLPDSRGERHGGAKLTDSDVREIRLSQLNQRALAKKFSVSPATICNILKGRNWSHVA